LKRNNNIKMSEKKHLPTYRHSTECYDAFEVAVSTNDYKSAVFVMYDCSHLLDENQNNQILHIVAKNK
jgi:hypothetical protein